MSDWFADNFGWFVGGLIVLLIGLVVWAVIDSSRDSDRFMSECMADGHKHYECEALYRQGQNHSVPVPVVVPVAVPR